MPRSPDFKDRNSEIFYSPKIKSHSSNVLAVKTISEREPVHLTSAGFFQKSFPITTWNANEVEKALNPYYGVVSGQYYAQTGMPWLSADARKAVKTEWFWQPIRGQPRRVDTNELRKYANTIWVQAIVMGIVKQVINTPWDVIPIDEETPYEQVQDEIEAVKNFLKNPNKNNESFEDIVSALLKDVLEIDAGVLVKVYTVDSFDFEHLEPRSGAPLLKPLICPECNGLGSLSPKQASVKALKVLKSIDEIGEVVGKNFKEAFEKLPEKLKDIESPHRDYSKIVDKMIDIVSYNSGSEANGMVRSCPFCNGSGTGRHLTEIYAQDGSAFLKDSDRTGWTYGYWHYSYSIPAHPMWFGPEEIIYFMENPRAMSVYGFSPMQSSLETVKALEYAVKHNMSLFLDGAVPDGVVSVEDMDDDELKRMQTKWENELKGQPHKTLFLNKKTTFANLSVNNKDMQYIEGMRELWKQVMSNFGVSPIDLGMTDELNRSTAGTAAEMGRRKAIRPHLTKIERLLNEQLLPELGVSNVKFAYTIDDPTEERMAAELAKIYIDAGIKSINEVRIEKGLPPVSWGDGRANSFGIVSNNFGQEGSLRGEISDVKKPEEEQGLQNARDDKIQNESQNDEKSFTWDMLKTDLEFLQKEEKITDKFFIKAFNEVKSLEKGYQYPFQAQVPFLTMIQNLSTPLPFALPRKGHVNTQYPYSEMSMLCPGCGGQQIMPMDYDVPGQLRTENWWQCQQCHREFSDADLRQAVESQERMHDKQDALGTQGMGGNPYSSADANRPVNRNDLNGVLADAKTRGIIAHPVPKIPAPLSTQAEYDEVEKPPFLDNRTGKYKTKGFKGLKKKVQPLEITSLEAWIGFEHAPLRLFIAQFLAGHDFSDINASKRKLKGLKNVFLDAFENGMNLQQLSAEIESLGFENADSIARTESIRIANEAKLLQAEANEHKTVIFTATKDSHTCKICESLNGKEYSITDAKGVIPGQTHSQCRCSWRVKP